MAKKLSQVFIMLSLLISHLGCVVCAYECANINAWYRWALYNAVPNVVRTNYWTDIAWTLCPKVVLFVVAVVVCLMIAKRLDVKYTKCVSIQLADSRKKLNRLVIIVVCIVSHVICLVVPYFIRYNTVIAESVDWAC